MLAIQTKKRTDVNPVVVIQVVLWVVFIGMFLGYAEPVLAQDEIGAVIATLVETITGIISSAAIGIGVLGLTMWAVGKIARPVFPQISQMTSNYIPDLLIGIAFVFVASSVVNGLAGAMGSTA